MDNNNAFSTTALKFGAYSALCRFAVFLAIYFTGYNPLAQPVMLTAWIPVMFIYMGINYYKNTEGKGLMTFRNAFRMGLFISIAYSFLTSAMAYVFGTVYAPDLIEVVRLNYLEMVKLKKNEVDTEVYNSLLKSQELITMKLYACFDFVLKVIAGLIVSLITAAVLKNAAFKENTEPEK